MPNLLLHSAISAAISALNKLLEVPVSWEISENSTLKDISSGAASSGIALDQILAGAALSLARERLGLAARQTRDRMAFLTSDLRPAADLVYTAHSSVQWQLSPEVLHRSVLATNLTIEIVHDLAIANSVPIFELLGLRNLSSFVGEIFARELRVLEQGRFMSNPNQDGYPDLCALTPEGAVYVSEKKALGQTSAKQFWSPYPFGGVEVKGTCGNTPAASKVAKPRIGESRYPILQSAEWKAHHRQTNNLLGIYWDFVDGLPTLLAAFFRNDLTENDWGSIIQPRQGGGRTTSVSLMTRAGVKKMGRGWVIVPDSSEILPRLAQSRVFALSEDSLRKNSSVLASRPKAL